MHAAVTRGFRGANEIHVFCLTGWRHAEETLELFTGSGVATTCSTPDDHPLTRRFVTDVKVGDAVQRFLWSPTKIFRDRLTIFSDPV